MKAVAPAAGKIARALLSLPDFASAISQSSQNQNRRAYDVAAMSHGVNRAIVCQPCNTDKGSRSLASFLFRLRRAADPRAPFVAAFIGR